ncbi:MAG: DUF5694 domain-containing protein [Planctomycetota bacterium]|jgi:hypothetical protein
MHAGFRSTRAALLVSIIGAIAFLSGVSAAQEQAQVLVLGTYHFANPGLDVVKSEVADVLTETKQAEIRAVAEALARFRPTKITVENKPADAPRLEGLYSAFRSGEHTLSRSETEQLGFRLAAMLDHPHVYPIDHGGAFPFGALMEYAQAHDPAFVAFVGEERSRMEAEDNRRQREDTVAEILRFFNDPKNLAHGHGLYMRFSRVGAGDTYVGAELLSSWYERNIHIFANLQQLAEPGDRVLVIIGAGHAPILRELITSDPDMTLVEGLDFLPPR